MALLGDFLDYVFGLSADDPWLRASRRQGACGSREPLPVIKNEEADRKARWAVGSAVAITVITLFVVLVLSVVTGKRVEGLTSKNPVTIQIIGHQWWWEINYPNPQADQTVTTANEIHVPVGTPVVIHEFHGCHSQFLGTKHYGKRDLLPDILPRSGSRLISPVYIADSVPSFAVCNTRIWGSRSLRSR